MRRTATLLFTLVALPAQAVVTLDAQTREVSFDSLRAQYVLFCTSPQSCSVLSQTLTPDADSESAPGFDPFSAALSSSIFPSVAVAQESTVTPARMQAHGSHAAAGAASLVFNGGFPPTLTQSTDEHETRSLYHVEFTLDEPTGYALTGTIGGGGAGFIGLLDMQIVLRRSTGEILHRIALVDDDECFGGPCAELGPLSLDENGTLAAGSYVLEAEIHGHTGALVSAQIQAANAHTGTFDVDLQFGTAIPMPPFVAPAVALSLAALARRRLARLR